MERLGNGSIADRFHAIRSRIGLNRKQFADELGIAPTVVSDIESAKREPSKDVLLRLSEVYWVNIHWMLTGNGPKDSRDLPSASEQMWTKTAIQEREAHLRTEAELAKLRADSRIGRSQECGDNVDPLQASEFSMVRIRRGVPIEIEPEENDPNGVVLLPLYNQRSAAGPGQEAIEAVEVETLVPVVAEILGHRDPRNCGVVRVVGDSMSEMQLNNGDRAIFDRSDHEGDGIFVITHNGAVRIKRLQYRFDVQRVFIKSENRRYPDVEEEPIEAIGSALRIEGKVIGWLHRHLY